MSSVGLHPLAALHACRPKARTCLAGAIGADAWVERHERIVLIDTGAVYGGLLSAFCPETDAVVQVLGERAQKPYPRAKDLKRVPAVLAGDPGSC